MDIPGRDPVILLWVCWVSLAPSHSLNLCHSLCGLLYNHLYCLPMTPLRVCVFLAVMTGDCGDQIPSKSKPQSAGVTQFLKFLSVFAAFTRNLSSNVIIACQTAISEKILVIRSCHLAFRFPLYYCLSL